MFDFDDNDYSQDRERFLEAPTKPATRAIANLAELNLDKELADQYAEAVSLRDWMLTNAEAHNPRDLTDAIKTVNTLLAAVIKMREQVQNLARMKAMEDAVISTMKLQSEEVRTEFFAQLGEAIK